MHEPSLRPIDKLYIFFPLHFNRLRNTHQTITAAAMSIHTAFVYLSRHLSIPYKIRVIYIHPVLTRVLRRDF